MTEHTQQDTKEQLNTAQKRLNTALNALEETIGRKIQEAVKLREASTLHKTQGDELQEYIFELEQHNTALVSKLHQNEERFHQLTLAYQEISAELAETIATLQAILEKYTLPETLAPCL